MIVISGGYDWDVINVTVNAATDTEITYTNPIRSFLLKTRDPNATIYFRRTLNDAEFITFLPGQPIEGELGLSNSTASGASIGFIRTDVPTVIEGVVTF